MRAERKKAKIEAEKARDEVEQYGYDVGIAETEDTLRAEVPTVCRAYYAQTWEEALNLAGVEASFELRRPENIYFPPAIRVSDLPSTQGEVAFTVADSIEETQPQDPLPPSQQEQTKEPEVSKEISSDKTAKVPQDGAASQGFEQALASVTMPAKGDPKEKEKKFLLKQLN